jgi:death on curing protein
MAQANPRYPALAKVIAIHEKVLHGLGEAPRALRAEGSLESALTRPQTAAYYEGANVVRQAALLGIGISRAQAFPDGNKRTAFASLDAFLWVNGWDFVDEPLELARRFEQFAEGTRVCRHLSQARAQSMWTPARTFLAVARKFLAVVS